MYTQPSFKPSAFSAFCAEIMSLPFGRRVVLGASFFSCIFLFFPWFYEGEYTWYTAFGKITIFSLFLAISAITPFYIVLREAFGKKGYWFGIPNQTLILILLSIGIYTLFLYTFSLYELLNYNRNANVGIGGMLAFISFGIALGGAILSHNFFPKAKPSNLMDTPEKIDTSKTSLEIEPQPLFSKDSD